MKSLRLVAILLLLIAGALCAYYANSLGVFDIARLRAQQQALAAAQTEHPLAFTLAYSATLISLVALSIPGTMVCMLLAGAVYQMPVAVALVLVCRTLGGALAFLLSRHLARDWFQQRFNRLVKSLDRGINREGWLYLLVLRLMPALPDSVINPGMGLTAIRLPVFVAVTAVGMVPWVVLYVSAGRELSDLARGASPISPAWLLVLTAVAALIFLGKRLVDRAPVTRG